MKQQSKKKFNVIDVIAVILILAAVAFVGFKLMHLPGRKQKCRELDPRKFFNAAFPRSSPRLPSHETTSKVVSPLNRWGKKNDRKPVDIHCT